MDKKKLKVLIACEESGIVTEQFRLLGIEAWSCDILPTSGNHPEWHLQQDVTELLKQQWDLIIAFPPCTDLAVSGARHFEQKRKDGRQQKSIEFFMIFANYNGKIAIENPVGIMSSLYRKPDQIIQPYQFGHPESKATCLWLKNIPKLQDTDNVKEIWKSLPKNQAQRIHYLPPSKDRAKIRSKTYPGIAKALAFQYGNFIKSNFGLKEWNNLPLSEINRIFA